MHFTISAKDLTIKDLQNLMHPDHLLEIDEESRAKIINCKDFLDKKLKNNQDVFYGINTGFGSLYNVKIEDTELEQLQENLVKSHACGIGNFVSKEIIRLMMILKIKNISLGHSAVSIEVVERLIEMYNADILPVIYDQGSLGASGDLAPLAHLSLPLLGLGEVWYKNEIKSTQEVFALFSWKPLKLKAKEGLALLNGTQFMSAHAVWSLAKIDNLLIQSEKIAALSLDAFDCSLNPFNPLIHKVRRQNGQIKVAANILSLLQGSPLSVAQKSHTQDPYAFRCIPQVHGATYDAVDFVQSIVENEINAVTDNPLIFPEDDLILSGGNFHGQPLAINLDFLAIAIAELASISERRIYQLISGLRSLPPFLVAKPGLNSGLMIAQYTAASIVSQNKQLCTPASVDSIVSSNGQEDHVSMGANAATKLIRVVENAHKVFAIEMINASQALSFRGLKTSNILEEFLVEFRKDIPIIENDRILHYDIVKAISYLFD